MSNPAIKQLFAEEHISVSAINTYLRCPRSYFLKYLEGAPRESRASALIFGSSIHEALAHFYSEMKMRKPDPSVEEIQQVFRDHFRLQLANPLPILYSPKESPDSLVDTGVEMLRVFHEKAERPNKVIDVEARFSIELVDWDSGEVLPRLVGFLDAVVADEQGKVTILEHKSAARGWPETRIATDGQVSAYSHVARVLGYGDADVVIQVLLKTKKPDFELYRPVRTDTDRNEFLDTAIGVLKAVDADCFYTRRDWWCRTCEFGSRCASA